MASHMGPVRAHPMAERMWCDPFQRKEAVDVDWWGCAPFVHGDETWLGGAIVDLAHVSFGLTLFNPGRHDPRFDHPGNPIRGTLPRSRYLEWELDGVAKRVNPVGNRSASPGHSRF